MNERVIEHLRRVPTHVAHSPLPGRSLHVRSDLSLMWSQRTPLHVSLMVDVPGRRPELLPAFPREAFAAGVDGQLVGLGPWSLLPDLVDMPGRSVELVLAGKGVGRNLAISLPCAALRAYLGRTFALVPRAAHLTDGGTP